jgi:hypothetical protein
VLRQPVAAVSVFRLAIASMGLPLLMMKSFRLIKGILRPDDAMACVESGASGIIVSNHGGRHLDTAIATTDTLAAIVDAVGSRPRYTSTVAFERALTS